MKSTLMIIPLVFAAGCSYPVRPTPVQADVAGRSMDGKKLKGVWSVALSERLTNRQETIVPYTQHCSGMKYPLDLGHQLSASLEQAIKASVERTAEAGDQRSADGAITVDLESFGARVGCFALLRCLANSYIGLRVRATDQSGNVLTDQTVRRSSEKSGFEGLACEGVATVLGDTVSQVIAESLQDAVAALAQASQNVK